MNLLKMSIDASIFILAIAFIRVVLKKRIPRKFFHYLWIIGLFKLLLPMNIGSKYSIFNYLTVANDQSMLMNHVDDMPLSFISAIPISDTTIQQTHSVNAIFLLWFIGSILFMVYLTYVYYKNIKILSSAKSFNGISGNDILKDYGLKCKYQLRQSNSIQSPLTYGVIKPVIVLPEAICIDKLDYILIHEIIHIKRLDNLSKIVFAIALSIHWFNPFVWIMIVLANRDMEIACDQKVLSIIGEDKKKDYAYCLLDFHDKAKGLSIACMFSRNVLKERMLSIVNYKQPTIKCIVLTVILLLSVTTVFATTTKDEFAGGNKVGMRDSEIDYMRYPLPYDKGITIMDYGEIKINNDGNEKVFFNKGTSIAVNKGTEVYSSNDGIVVISQYNNEAGNHIVIQHENNIKTYYYYLDELMINEGDKVSKGSLIAKSGSTGLSTGPMLYFMVEDNGEFVDPNQYIPLL